MNFFHPSSRLPTLAPALALALALTAAVPLSASSWFHRKPKPASAPGSSADSPAGSLTGSPTGSPTPSAAISATAGVSPAAAPPKVVVPDPTAAQLTLEAQAAYQRGEMNRAGKLFAKASALDGENPAPAYNAGIFFFQAGDSAKAAKYFHRALKRNPDHALAHYFLGLIFEKAGNYDGAIREYGEAARRDRRVLDAGYNKEVVQSRLTMDVRLRRYLDGDRPLDFAAVTAPGDLPPPKKPEEKPKARVEAKPAPRPEIRIDSKPSTPAPEAKRANGQGGDGPRPGDPRKGRDRGAAGTPGPIVDRPGGNSRGSAGERKPDAAPDTDPKNNPDEEYPPLPPVPPPERRNPDIDRP